MKNVFKLGMFVVFAVTASVVYAHPASDVSLALDSQTKILSVDIKHQVSDPLKHYIDNVEITLNGQPSIHHLVTRQATATGEILSYSMPDVKNGDVVAVDTHCNKGGNRQQTLTAQVM